MISDDALHKRLPLSAPRLKEEPLQVTTYASLLNRKLVMPSLKNFLAVDQHLLIELMQPWIEKIRVDEQWYRTNYRDIQTAIESGIVSDGKTHFCRFGFFEHRMPYKIVVDEPWYVNEYPDVRNAVAAKSFKSGQMHFEQVGYKEGRMPYSGFQLDAVG